MFHMNQNLKVSVRQGTATGFGGWLSTSMGYSFLRSDSSFRAGGSECRADSRPG